MAPRPRSRQDYTPRQLEIAALVAAGKTRREIAFALNIADETVKAHITRLADHIPNPHDLPPRAAITLWFRSRAA